MVDTPRQRGWKFDGPNGYMEAWDSGTAIARFDASTGVTLLIDAFDLNGQTITTASANGTADMSTWVATFNGASGASDETPKYAVKISVGGTAYYVPAFTSV
jgi:hypothetical protein